MVYSVSGRVPHLHVGGSFHLQCFSNSSLSGTRVVSLQLRWAWLQEQRC